jgi:Flp pilus assembly pilin Flp
MMPQNTARTVHPVRNITRHAARHAVAVLRDQSGGEVLEYSMVAGLIVIAAIGLIRSVGTRVLARWSSLNASL